MRDYVTPLEELTTVLSNALDTLHDAPQKHSSGGGDGGGDVSSLPDAMVSLGS